MSSIVRVVALALLLAVPSVGRSQPPETPTDAALQPLVKMTAQEDHRRVLGLLGIASLRRGPSGDPKSPDAANSDESKATTYETLPDPLVFDDGTPVTTSAHWSKRRMEIVELFDREVYGRAPTITPRVTWEVTETKEEKVGEVPVVTKTLVGHVDNAAYPLVTVDIQLTLTTPAEAAGPVPVVMEFGFGAFGRRTGGEPGRRPGGGPGRPGGGGQGGPTWQQQVIEKGWGYAILVPNSVQADNGGGLTEGIIGLCNRGQPRNLDDWGALRAWAWGASRALDYFETDEAVDASRVAIEGLSRYGKAALVTMAYDERFAIAFVGSSGAGGAKLHRRTFGEQVENVASSGEYHWMAGNFVKYAGPLTPNDLPVDSHQLIALCAPRPVFIGAGSPTVEGTWIDARGQFLAAVGAGSVYELLGKRGLGTAEMPPIGTGLLDGEIAFRQHEGGHTNGPNWETFLRYAERYLARGAESTGR